MSSELIKKLEDYRTELTTKLNEAKAERKTLIDKVSKGERLTSKEGKRNEKLAELIKELEAKLAMFKEADVYNGILKGLEDLSKTTISKDEKDKIIKSILANIKKFNKDSLDDLKRLTGFTAKDLKDLPALQTKLETELHALEIERANAEKRKHDTKDIQADIDEVTYNLEQLKAYLKTRFDEAEVEADLKRLTDSKIKKEDKQAIIDKYKTIIEAWKNSVTEDIVIAMEEDEKKKAEKKNKKKKTKEEKEKKDGFLQKHKKKIIAIAGTVVLCVVIASCIKSCSKQQSQNNTTPEDTKEPYGIEQIYENVDKELVDALTKKGYNEYDAVLMVANFPADVIDTLLKVPYIAGIEQYATAKGFNLNYIEEYEDARIKYELTASKAVDYVNRAVEIQLTRFYEDATINEIVEIVMAIDNEELFTQNNANLAQSFNTSFNRVVDNYLFGTTTKEDIAKIDAIPHFAEEGSDMDLFLTEYATLAKAVISNPEDVEAKNKMYDYIATFALSVNGFTNKDEDIPVSEPYNTNAQVNSYYDWYMIYDSFIKPLYPTFVNDAEFEKYEYLQIVMESALQGPEFDLVCGESRNLGGN